MVTTRSRGNPTKHEAPKGGQEAPAKKQKTSKTTKKEVENRGSKGGKSSKEKDVPEVKNEQKPEANETSNKQQTANGKPPADEPAAAEAEKQTAGGAARDSKEATAPILEKGIFYFFLRPRVNTTEVTNINDVQKSYLLLRPTPTAQSITSSKLRMIQIPKKALPATGTHQRFLAFVIQSDEHIKDLKDDIGEHTYSTATRGERLQPAARPVAEGVYAIVGDQDGRTTHFAYLLTLPAHATDVQKEFGLSDQGSFVMSTRNPAKPAPPQARGLQGADYPEKIKEQFRGRKWMNLLPEHLDYNFTQILFIGEKSNISGDIDELEQLEEEDEARVNHLKGEDAVFKDLKLSKKEFSPGALHGELD